MYQHSTPFDQRGTWYRDHGLEPVINAKGTYTTIGGSLLHPEVTAAMDDAATAFISMESLNDMASSVIAEHTGGEAGIVTAGAAAAMTLQAAVCIAGGDRDSIPVRSHGRKERPQILVKDHHNNHFVRMWRDVGAEITWVGDGPTVSDSEIETAISDRTVALGFVASLWHPDSLSGVAQFAAIGQEHDIPVIVDAAAMLPPASHLTDFIDAGADLVAFSGGKAIGGPQSTGMLTGRADLIAGAREHNSPEYGINRGAKVCKEEIAGFITALERFVATDPSAREKQWESDCERIIEPLANRDGLDVAIEQDNWNRPVPTVTVRFTEAWNDPSVASIQSELRSGSPPIAIGVDERLDEDFSINPHCLQEGEADMIASRLIEVLDIP